MKVATASRLTSTYFGGNSTVLGAVGGAESHTLTKAELPATPATGTITNGAITTTSNINGVNGTSNGQSGSDRAIPISTAQTIASTQATSTFTGGNLGSGDAHAIVQPTIVCNYIMRII